MTAGGRLLARLQDGRVAELSAAMLVVAFAVLVALLIWSGVR